MYILLVPLIMFAAWKARAEGQSWLELGRRVVMDFEASLRMVMSELTAMSSELVG